MSKTAGTQIVLTGSDSYTFKGKRFVRGVIYNVPEGLADDLLERSINDEGDVFYFAEPGRREADYEVVDLVANPNAKAGQRADRAAPVADEGDDDEGEDSGDRRSASQRGRRTVAKKTTAKTTDKKTIKVGGGTIEGMDEGDEAGAGKGNKDEGAVEV